MQTICCKEYSRNAGPRERSRLQKTVEVGADSAFGHLQAVDACCIESRIIIDLDAIDPLEHQHALGYIQIINTRNVDHGVIFEHLLKAFGISSLLNVVDLFIDRPFKLVVDTHEINKLVRIYEACNDPENELEATQIHLHEPVTIGPLDFDGHHFTGGSEDCFMDLTERGGGSTFALQHAEHFLNRLAQLRLDHTHNMVKWCRRHFILQ